MEEARRKPTEQDLLWLIDEGRNWVYVNAKYRPIAVPLSDPLKAHLASFFALTTPDAPAILGVTRYCSVPVIENPPFRAEPIDGGLIRSGAMDFTKMAGLTFQDTFLISQAGSRSNSETNALVFHELVHVVQYAVLGIDEFLARYARGMAGGRGDYYAIPLELVAYTLQGRFMTDPETEFSVAEFV